MPHRWDSCNHTGTRSSLPAARHGAKHSGTAHAYVGPVMTSPPLWLTWAPAGTQAHTNRLHLAHQPHAQAEQLAARKSHERYAGRGPAPLTPLSPQRGYRGPEDKRDVLTAT